MRGRRRYTCSHSFNANSTVAGSVEEVVEPFRQGTSAGLVTLKKEVFHDHEFADPGVVKVTTGRDSIALYFSRSLIPYPRNRTPHFRVFEHVGIYAYTRECLLKLAALPVSPLEEIEGLNNCAHSRMAFQSLWSRRRAARRVFRSIHRRTSSAFARLCGNSP